MKMGKIMKFNMFLFCFATVLNEASPLLLDMDENNWSEVLEGEWMIEFFAPWCPACQQLEPIWTDFSESSEEMNIRIAKVDVTQNPGLSGRFAITALPTIFHVKDSVFRQYRGGKTKDSLVQFIMNEQWQKLDPLPYWKSPQSFLMSSSSYLYRMSILLKDSYNVLLEFGMPMWVVIIIFVVATMLLGTILGFVLVLIIDFFSRFIYPGSQTQQSQYQKLRGSDDSKIPSNAQAIYSDEPEDDLHSKTWQSEEENPGCSHPQDRKNFKTYYKDQDYSDDGRLSSAEGTENESSANESESDDDEDKSSEGSTLRRRGKSAENEI